MTGKWGVYRHGERWRRSRRRAWLVIRTPEHEVVQFDGPVLELTTDSRTRFDQRITGLGPDILAPDFDEQRFLRRLREDDQTRGIGDALLDQRNLAGIGNVWKAEACFMAGLDPFKATGEVPDEQVLELVRAIRPLMERSAQRGGRITTFPGDRPGATWVYERDGRPCRRCGAIVQARGQGDDNRTTFWCPGCQG
jgi:endonuclease-8